MIPVLGFAQKIFGLGTMWFDQRQDGGGGDGLK
jgi:hypothetical protein